MALLASFSPNATIFLAGDSAGAGLALSTTLECLRRQKEHDGASCPKLPAGIAMVSPYLDLTMTSPGFDDAMFRYEDGFGDIFYSNHDRASDPQADREWLQNRAKDYIGTASPDDPRCSPCFMSDAELGQFPPILAMVGGHEVFAHETRRFAERAQSLGVPCTLSVYPWMWHDWLNYCELPQKLQISSSALRPAVL